MDQSENLRKVTILCVSKRVTKETTLTQRSIISSYWFGCRRTHDRVERRQVADGDLLPLCHEHRQKLVQVKN